MKKLLFTLLTALAALGAQANDGVYYTSGNQLIPLVETDISVRSEVLTITLDDSDQALVDVYYEFYNPGTKAKTVLMGFEADPSYNDDYELHSDGKHPHIKQFTVEMNGQRIRHRNALSDVTAFAPLDARQWELGEWGSSLVNKRDAQRQIEHFAYVYYFDATFQPGINRVHHTYTYTKSGTVYTNYEVCYKLSPAGRWAGGRIGDFTLNICVDKTAKHFVIPCNGLPNLSPQLTSGKGKMRQTSHNETEYWEVSLRDGAIRFHAKNFRPSEEEELNLLSADAIHIPAGDNFGSYYDRTWILPLYLPQSYEVETTVMTPQFMERIAHNLPYAHRGRIFKNPEVKRYIESQWWYMPDPTYQDDTSDFTEKDWEYVKFQYGQE